MKSQNSRNQGFSYYFCLLIEEAGSGFILRTNGSGSGWPKNMWGGSGGSGFGSGTLTGGVRIHDSRSYSEQS
jgi:hypothetical protein